MQRNNIRVYNTNQMHKSATTLKQKQINMPPTTHSNQFQLFHDSNRQQYGMYIINYSIELIAFLQNIHYSTIVILI